MTAFPEYAVLKTVPLKFSGVELKLKTSHALFSSHHVDDGTMLLLKTLAQQGSVPLSGRVLDAGCGTGALGLALKKFRPALEVTARDRLALAAAFTAENARLNSVTVDAAPGLLLEGTPGPWDLIVSNLPAKAGEPVLADFVVRSLGLLAPSGLAAVVVVEPLAAWFSAELAKTGAQRVFEEPARGYRVFHYRSASGSAAPGQPPFPAAYARAESPWAVGPLKLNQKTFYGLPNFDGLDFRLQVTLRVLEDRKLRGDGLVWEPVQGHLATWADAVLSEGAVLHLAGNDALGLAAAAANVTRRTPERWPVPTLADLTLGAGSLGWALVQLHPEPEVPWVEATLEALCRLLAPGAQAVVNGGSTDLTRLLERHKGLRKVADVRLKGWRVVVLERQSHF
jgi:SAM-dependent methyltransferase